ncbi:hypothetical protein T492DRAFT_841626 [Pavlovales sp. CCMP2436]|nr:hypothetical protein T492DRAFT_841626 [Pavlovales sp. CCMP2436]
MAFAAELGANEEKREDHEHRDEARAKLLAVSFECSPMAVAMLDSANIIVIVRHLLVNQTLKQQMGPLYCSGAPFNEAAADQESNDALTAALDKVRKVKMLTVKVGNVKMLTVAGGEGFPIIRHVDWSLRQGTDGLLCAVGEIMTEADEVQREKDAELIDYFQEVRLRSPASAEPGNRGGPAWSPALRSARASSDVADWQYQLHRRRSRCTGVSGAQRARGPSERGAQRPAVPKRRRPPASSARPLSRAPCA